jgi:catechol 2,3-dioxygenase-like lactoylglutathione lyase family enzyme
MLSRVDHVGIVSKDVDSALKFYSGMLGLAVNPPEEHGMFPGVEIPVGKSAIRIAQAGDDEPEGISYLCFERPGQEASEWLDPEDNHGLKLALVPPRAVPEPDPARDIECIDHVVITSSDSAACAAHFRDYLGLEIKRAMTRPGTGAHLEFAKLVDVVIEFGGPPEPKPGPLNPRAWGMVFTVRDIDAQVAHLREAGYPVTDPRPAVQPGAKISMVKEGTGGVPFALIQYNAL